MGIIIDRVLTSRNEKLVFYVLAGIFTGYVWSLPVFVTMDGPAHLYNASLLNIYQKSEFISSYLDRNHYFIPNYLSTFILGCLLKVMDAFAAEKTLVSLIVLFLPITFRALIKKITNATPWFAFLVFPLVYSNLLHTGFYNFSLAFILFNLQVYMTLCLTKNSEWKWWVLIFINSILLYYCHFFVYCLAFMTTFFFLRSVVSANLKPVLPYLLKLLLIYLPTICFSIFFLLKSLVPTFQFDLEPDQKTINLLTFSPAIVFERKEELFYSSLFSILLIALSAVSLHSRQLKFKVVDFFLLAALGFVFLVYHSTDGAMGGMFMNRLFFTIFYLGSLWLACTMPVSGKLHLFSLTIVILVMYSLLSFRHKSLSRLNDMAMDIRQASSLVREKSVVKTVVLSNYYFISHLSNYLAVNKEVLMLDNYEAKLDWFPLKWNKKMEVATAENGQPNLLRPDYLLIYGTDPKARYKLPEILKGPIALQIHKIYQSRDNFCTLYEVRK